MAVDDRDIMEAQTALTDVLVDDWDDDYDWEDAIDEKFGTSGFPRLEEMEFCHTAVKFAGDYAGYLNELEAESLDDERMLAVKLARWSGVDGI